MFVSGYSDFPLDVPVALFVNLEVGADDSIESGQDLNNKYM